jgi:hypothetical protein
VCVSCRACDDSFLYALAPAATAAAAPTRANLTLTPILAFFPSCTRAYACNDTAWRCACERLQREAVGEGLAAAATTGASAAVRAAAASQRHEVRLEGAPRAANVKFTNSPCPLSSRIQIVPQ